MAALGRIDLYDDGIGYVELLQAEGSVEVIASAARVSYGRTAKGEKEDRQLIRNLLRWGHFSPLRHTLLTYRLHVPIFVARQLMRSHVGIAWNELSRRYTSRDVAFYTPKTDFAGVYQATHEKLYATYRWLLQQGERKEVARAVLPVGTYTTLVMSANLNALINLWLSRLRPEVQPETREATLATFRLFRRLDSMPGEEVEDFLRESGAMLDAPG